MRHPQTWSAGLSVFLGCHGALPMLKFPFRLQAPAQVLAVLRVGWCEGGQNRHAYVALLGTGKVLFGPSVNDQVESTQAAQVLAGVVVVRL